MASVMNPRIAFALCSLVALARCAPMAPVLDASTEGGADASVPSADALPANVTWSEHVAPIVFQHCASCHRSGGIAPFSLITYADARDRARSLANESAARTMPPTLVDNSGACNAFESHSADWLSNDEIATLAQWAAQGAPEGDPSRAPSPPAVSPGLSPVDARVDLGVTFTPDPARMDELRCFIVDAPSATDQFVTGYQVEPGDARVVHHAILYALEDAAGVTAVTALDARDARDGYECPGGPMAAAAPVVLWAPGVPPVMMPEGTGLRVTGGRKMVLQMHYNMGQGSFPDRTRVALRLAPTVRSEARMVSVSAANLRLPPRMTNATAEGTRALPASAGPLRIWGVAPHMHTLGTDMQVSLRSNSRCVMDLHHWNFHWQRMFFYRAPLDVSAGDSLAVRCSFDTSTRNELTTWGEATTDEMCLAYAYVTAR